MGFGAVNGVNSGRRPNAIVRRHRSRRGIGKNIDLRQTKRPAAEIRGRPASPRLAKIWVFCAISGPMRNASGIGSENNGRNQTNAATLAAC